jgi:hypothetical protein
MAPMQTGEYTVKKGERFVARLSFHPETESADPVVLTGYTFTGAMRQTASAEETLAVMETALVPADENAPEDTAVDCSIDEDLLTELPVGVYSISVLAEPPADGAPFWALEATLRIKP